MSALPDVLNVQTVATSVQTMNIETNQLDPVVINQQFCRFVLEKKGILDVGSTFTFSVHPVDATGSGKCFLPIKTGIHSLIKRAVLKVGTKVLATSDDYAWYQTMRRAFKTNEEKAQKDLVKVGSCDVLEPNNQGTGKYQLKSVIYSAEAVSNFDPAIKLTSSETECPIFSVKLSELFPMMRNLQLPLYLINEHVSVEISFNQQPAGTEGLVAIFDDGYAGSTQMRVGTENVKFLADYLTYANEKMDATAKQVMSETGLVLPYEDLILITTNVPAVNPAPVGTNVSTQNVSRELGLSGKYVRSILMHENEGSNSLMGYYASRDYPVSSAYNWRINDKLVYSRDVVNPARKYNQLSQVFSTNMNCNIGEWSFDVQTNKQSPEHPINNLIISDNTVAGIDMSGLAGQMHFEGVDLSVNSLNLPGTGTLVGQKPVEHIRTIYRTATSNSAKQVRYYALVEKAMTLKNGQVMVSA